MFFFSNLLVIGPKVGIPWYCYACFKAEAIDIHLEMLSATGRIALLVRSFGLPCDKVILIF